MLIRKWFDCCLTMLCVDIFGLSSLICGMSFDLTDGGFVFDYFVCFF